MGGCCLPLCGIACQVDFKFKCVHVNPLPNPSQVSDSDPRLFVSGMQQFQGEDINYEGRKQDQQEQRRWVVWTGEGEGTSQSCVWA